MSQTAEGQCMLPSDKDIETSAKCSFFLRLRNKDEYRRKIQLTCAVCGSYIVLGWVILQIGTALPDLQVLMRVDLETISWLFTAWSIGYIIGSLISGIAYDRWNRLKLMAFSTVGLAVSSILLPWLPSFPLSLVIRVATGVFSGAVDTGANTIVPSIWGSKAGPFMQALYLSYTVGGITSPLLTRPFMAVKINDFGIDDRENTTSNDIAVAVASTGTGNMSVGHNISALDRNASSVALNNSGKDELRIHYAFVITGVLAAVSAIPYFIMFCSSGYDVKANRKDSDASVAVKRDLNISKSKIFIIVFFVCAVNILYAGAEDSLGAFLVTFSIYQMHWDKTKAVVLSALYWSGSCLGGIIGIVFVRRIGIARMTFIAFTIWMASFLGALLSSQFQFYYLVWMFIPLSGMCMVVIIPNVISWTEAHVCNVSGKVSSLIMMSTGIGIASNPPFIGYLMEKYSIICLLYVLSVECLICCLCFTTAYSILYCCNFEFMERRSDKRDNENSKEYFCPEISESDKICALVGTVETNGDKKCVSL